jgi:Cytotoxic
VTIGNSFTTYVHLIATNTPGQPVPAPKELEAFPDAERAKPKTPVQGGGGLRQRWKDSDGNIYEWDRQHGTVEKYNKRANIKENATQRLENKPNLRILITLLNHELGHTWIRVERPDRS